MADVPSGGQRNALRLRGSVRYFGLIPNVIDPRARLAIVLVIGRNARLLLQRQLDLVEPFEQSFAPPRRDGEGFRIAARKDDLLPLQIDRQLTIDGIWRDRGSHLHNHVLLEREGKNPVLEAVCNEEIGETWRNHATDAHAGQSPYRAFARTSATEIAAGQ